MYRKSEKDKQLNMFSAPSELLKSTSLNFYENDDSWHNMFRKQVLMRIDEDIFSVLFSSSKGAPNAPIRILIGMMILKEGQGWSDEQLFENCNYNVLYRSALGLMNFDDTLPVPSTYYLFRRNMASYNKIHNTDLFKLCQNKITKSQILDFQVSGKQIRMDSKLIGSNIAWYNRYELVHQTVRLFIAERKNLINSKNMNKQELLVIESVMNETGSKVIYRYSKQEVDARMVVLGALMHKLIKLFKNQPDGKYNLLKTVFKQQFRILSSRVIVPLENEQISSDTIQSPHDTDAHYRNKSGNKIKGYVVNLTETCDKANDDDISSEPTDQPDTKNKAMPGPLNLITDIQVEPVTASDSSFLETALSQTKELLSNDIQSVYADGAYNSPDNQDYCQQNNIDLILSALQGGEPRYEISLDTADENNLIVLDTKTGLLIDSKKVKSKNGQNKWRIITENGSYRYFNMNDIRISKLRIKIKSESKQQTNIRNNVEASIFQLGFHFSNDKTKYRSLQNHKLWAYSRSLWINFRRILKYVNNLPQNTFFFTQNSLFGIFSHFYNLLIVTKNLFMQFAAPSDKLNPI